MYVRFSLSLLVLLCMATCSAQGAEDSAPTLKGGVKDRVPIQPSIKVEVPPAPAPSPPAHPLEGCLVTSRPALVHRLPLWDQPPMIVPHPVLASPFNPPSSGLPGRPVHGSPTVAPPFRLHELPPQSTFVGPNPDGLAHIPYLQAKFRHPAKIPKRPDYTATDCVKSCEPEYETKVVQSVPLFEAHKRIDSRLRDEETAIRMRPSGKQYAKEPQPVKPLAAVAESLPAVKATIAANWDDWYKQIAKEVYRQWERAPVCPGKATVCVSVYNTRDVDSQIINFEDFSTDKADPSNQSAFCKAAIDSVDHLNRFQFWQFPANAPAGMRLVKLNIQFKREVGGKAGCEVSKSS